jgi:hypothetical protein
VSSGLAVRPRDVEEAAALSKQGSVDELAFVVASHAGASQAKLRELTGLPQVVLDRLLSSSAFRRFVSEALTLQRVNPRVERAILDRFVGVVQDPESKFSEFRESADWLLQQGGVKRAERSEVQVGGRVRVEFVVDAPELDGAGYSPPNPLAGVVGFRSVDGSSDRDEVEVEHRLVDEAAVGS